MMKKLFLGATVGVLAGALGYKVYKENEEEVKEFLDDCLVGDEDYDDYEDYDEEDIDDQDIYTEGLDLEELEELRDHLNNKIKEIYDRGIDAETFETPDNYDDDYICIKNDSFNNNDVDVDGEDEE